MVKILDVSDDVSKEALDENFDELQYLIAKSYISDPDKTVKLFKFTLHERMFFGLIKRNKEVTIPVTLNSDEDEFKKKIIGHTFDVIL